MRTRLEKKSIFRGAGAACAAALILAMAPSAVSAQTQALARVALANTAEMLGQVDVLREECQKSQQWLRRLGLQVVPSQANFCLFGRFADRHAVWQQLRRRALGVSVERAPRIEAAYGAAGLAMSGPEGSRPLS